MMVSFVLSFFPRDVLDEILNLIESVSEDFPSYSERKHECLFSSSPVHTQNCNFTMAYTFYDNNLISELFLINYGKLWVDFNVFVM